jgi:hypothetical protein
MVRETVAIRRLVEPTDSSRPTGAKSTCQFFFFPAWSRWVSRIFEYWQHVIFGFLLLLVDFLIAQTIQKKSGKGTPETKKRKSLGRVAATAHASSYSSKLYYIFPIWTKLLYIAAVKVKRGGYQI